MKKTNDKQKELDAFKKEAGRHCPETDYAKIQRDIQTRRQMKIIMTNLLTSVNGLITTLETTRKNQSQNNNEASAERKRLDALYKEMHSSIQQSTALIKNHAQTTRDVKQSIENDEVFKCLINNTEETPEQKCKKKKKKN